MSPSFLRFLDHTQRRTTVGRTPLDEWPARRRDLYLMTHNTHNRQTSMLPGGFEPTISAGERPKTYALDLAATGTGLLLKHKVMNSFFTSHSHYCLLIIYFLIMARNLFHTSYQNISNKKVWAAWSLRTGPIDCFEMSVTNYQSTLLTIQEE